VTGAAPTEATGVERLELADWRRRVSDLYAAVRAEAARDPEAAWRLWRETRESLFRKHPQSPVPLEERPGFRARHWRYDPRLRSRSRSPSTRRPTRTARLPRRP
jgi:hypothetical protein